MNILLIAPWDIKCGISLYTENLYREIRGLGHNVSILAEEADERNRRFEVPEDGVVRCWRRCGHWQSLLELARGLRGIDIVNVQHETSYCWEPHLWHQLIHGLHEIGLPVVATYHTIPYTPNGVTDNPEVDGIIVCNPKARQAMVRRGWPADRIWRTQHGILPPCEPPTRPPQGRLAVCGFLTGQKGYSEVMQAMELLLPKHPDVRLSIFGSISEHIKDRQEDYYYDHLRHEVSRRGLQDRVAMLMGFPHQEMLQRLLADHDILTLYYQTASVGYCESGALHTGLAACRPIVVSEAHHFDCSPEMEPYLLKASSVQELSSVLDRLLSDPDFYFQACARVHELALSRPLVKAAQEYVACFEAVLKTNEVPSRQRGPLALLGALVLSCSKTALLDRAVQSISDTSPGIPVVVVDTVGSHDAADLMRGKWGMVTYICARGALIGDAVRLGVEALGARYVKIVREDNVMLNGWYDEHRALCQRGFPLISCAGVRLNGNTGFDLLREEVRVSTQVCVDREAFSSLGGLVKVDVQAEAREWWERFKQGGFQTSHVPVSCFLWPNDP